MTIPTQMRAVEISAPGGPDVLVPTERPVPVPKPHEILVKVAAAGVNRPDVLQRLGKYKVPADASDLPGHVTNRVVTLGSHGVDVWRYQTPTLRRGLYSLGPVTVTSADPFGFFRMSRTFGEPIDVLVYPNAPELPGLYLPPASLPECPPEDQPAK